MDLTTTELSRDQLIVSHTTGHQVNTFKIPVVRDPRVSDVSRDHQWPSGLHHRHSATRASSTSSPPQRSRLRPQPT